MEPTEINGGRFYARPLHHDERIDDSMELALSYPSFEPVTVEEVAAGWNNDTMYSWAICEQTSVNMIGLALLHRTDQGNYLDVVPVGDPARMLPQDPALEPKKVGDVVEIRGPLSRWAQAQGIELS